MAHHILLFHYGKFIGTATYEPYSFSPSITRVSDSSISVTYRYMKDDENPANASGRTTASFSWSASQNKVVMSGEVPPSGEWLHRSSWRFFGCDEARPSNVSRGGLLMLRVMTPCGAGYLRRPSSCRRRMRRLRVLR